MKISIAITHHLPRITPGLCAIIVCSNFGLQVFGQGTAFTYQGRLNSGVTPANGLYDFRFRLAADPLANNYIGSAFLTNSIGVTNGLFITTMDFGPGIFTGSNYWLEVDVRTNGASSYTMLTPLQGLTPTPYAIFANGASNLLGSLPAAQLSGAVANGNLPASPTVSGTVSAGAFSGNGANVTNVNAAALNGLRATNFWQTSGNSGTAAGPNYVGTTDNQPVEIHVHGLRALRLEPVGSSSFLADGAPTGAPNVIGGALFNYVMPGVVGATISGGGCTNYGSQPYSNSIAADFGTICGGLTNVILTNALFSTIGGGAVNQIQYYAAYSTIAGGGANTIENHAQFGTIGGGADNLIQSNAIYSTIAGGANNSIQTNSFYATISGGFDNLIQTNSSDSTMGGGYLNLIQSDAPLSTIGGGQFNQIDSGSFESVIAGGGNGNGNDPYANWIQSGSWDSAIGGGEENLIETNAHNAVIAGGWDNTIQLNSYESVIGGGGQNNIQAFSGFATVGGGYGNNVAGGYATVPGGYQNSANGPFSFAAGQDAQALNQGAFVWADSQPFNYSSTGNDQFCIRAQGGVHLHNSTSIAFGNQTRQMVELYRDSTSTFIYGLGVQTATLYMRSGTNGGFAWYSGGTHNDAQNNPGSGITLMTLAPITGNLVVKGTVTQNSDRNLKTNLTTVDSRDVLERLAAVPMMKWTYKTEDPSIRHLGPMAQDFQAAFHLGEDDKHITTVDEGGVALAAIQGLNEKLEARSQKLETENADLKQQLAELKALVERLAQPK